MSADQNPARCICRDRNGQLGCQVHETGIYAAKAQPSRSASPDYVVIRDGQVVQEISALAADNAYAEKTEEGALYARVGATVFREIDAFIEDVRR